MFNKKNNQKNTQVTFSEKEEEQPHVAYYQVEYINKEDVNEDIMHLSERPANDSPLGINKKKK